MKTKQSFKLVFLAVVYLVVAFALMFINRYYYLAASNVFYLKSIRFSGIITVFQIFVTAYMTLSLGEAGYRLAIVLSGIYGATMMVPIVIYGSFESISGLAMVMGGVFMLTILHKYLKQVEAKEGELIYLAQTDTLTKLPNRREFENQLEKLLKGGVEDLDGWDGRFAVAFIDIDSFKSINDTMGHDVGDAVLCEVVERWKLYLEDGDFLSRQGGDEFAVLLRGFKSKRDLYLRIKRFSDALLDKIHFKDLHFYVTGSIGIAIYPDDNINVSTLLRYADMAMYYAKQRGKNGIVFYDSAMMSDVEREIVMESKIKNALKNNDYYLLYQPQYSINEKKIRAFEALVRMHDKDGKVVDPANFIPLAEKTSIIIDIEQFVLQKAMSDFAVLLDSYDDIVLSINISVVYLLYEGFLENLNKALMETSFPPEKLEIEITESVLITSVERAIRVMGILKEMGIRIAFDDFGTGYASLGYLTKLPISLLKIDREFIDVMLKEKSGRDFVAAIISMGHLLHFDVLAEGVETEEQLHVLQELNCDYIQGYLMGRPMSYDNICKLLDY